MAKFDLGLLQRTRRPLVMGILNVTPDSFSDGGQFDAPAAARSHAQEMLEGGADIIDVGGESTRPGATFVEEQDELDRVLPVLDALRDLNICVSIDTYKAQVASAACAAGAQIVNDVWGLQKDPDMAQVVADAGVPVVMMHNREQEDPSINIMDDIERWFEVSIGLAEAAGIPSSYQILDPGFGFKKTLEQNYQILQCFEDLHKFGRPMLAGASRKRMIGHVLNNEAQDRMAGSLTVHSIALEKGAQIVRAHDVKPHADAVRVIGALRELGGNKQ